MYCIKGLGESFIAQICFDELKTMFCYSCSVYMNVCISVFNIVITVPLLYTRKYWYYGLKEENLYCFSSKHTISFLGRI